MSIACSDLEDTVKNGLAVLLLFESEDGVCGGRIAHKSADIRLRIPLLVNGPRKPAAVDRFLVNRQPSLRAPQRLGGATSGLPKGERGETGGVAIGPGFERRIVMALPGTQIGETPASVFLLFGGEICGECLLLLRGQNSVETRGRPEHRSFVYQGLGRVLAAEVAAEEVDVLLNCGIALIVVGSETNSEGGDGGTPILGFVRFP